MLVPLLVFSFACGDDDAATDSGTDAATPDSSPGDTGGEADAGNDSGAEDAGASDAGAADAGTADAGPEIPVCGEGVEGPCCFDISETIGDLPFAIPDTFDESTPTWNRPTDDCPSDALSDDEVPFVAYTYCNKGDVATDFQFEVGGDEEGPTMMAIANALIVAYSGAEINAAPAMCGAYNEPLLGQAEFVLTLAPGEVVTIVSTTRDAGDYGGLQSIAGEPTE